MARRRSRRTVSDKGAAVLGIVTLAGIVSAYQWAEALPTPWKVAAGLFALSAVLLVAWAITNLIRHWRTRQLLRIAFERLTHREFELRVQQLLADLGWTKLEHRGGSGDRGADLIGHYQGQRYIIQCKHYRKKVPPAHVRDLVGTLHIQKADRALLVTTSGFTAQGYEEARNQPIELWDGPTLALQMEQADALRADPARARATRKRVGMVLAGAVLINTVAIAYAFGATGALPPIVAGATINTAGPTSLPTLIPVRAPAVATIAPATTSVAVLIPLSNAPVISTGNLYALPDQNSAVRGRIHAGETVHPTGRSADGGWIQLLDARDMNGWARITLLTLAPDSLAQLPIVTP
jgi:restriction system protein